MKWELFIKNFKWLEPCYYFKLDEEFYHVVSKDFLYYEYEGPEVAPGGESSKIILDGLKPDRNQIYIFTVGIKQKGIKVIFYQPTSESRFGTKEAPDAEIDYEISPAENPNPAITFITTPTRTIAVVFKNYSDVALKPKLVFYGIKCTIEKVRDPELIKELEAKFRAGKIPELETEFKKKP